MSRSVSARDGRTSVPGISFWCAASARSGASGPGCRSSRWSSCCSSCRPPATGAGVLLGIAWLLVQLTLLARTRSLSLAALGRFCACGAVLGVAIGLVEVVSADAIGWGVSSDQATSFLAGPIEEMLKLVPLLGVALLAWNRVRRFGATDFLLVAAASGAGFQLVEDLLRRTVQKPWFIGSVLMDGDQFTNYGPWTLFPGWADYDELELSGHAVSSGLVGAAIGLAVLLAARGGGWRLTWVLPAITLAWVTADHMVFNDTTGLGAARLLPAPLVDLHEMVGGGHANRYALLTLLAAAVAVDYAALRRGRTGVPALPGPRRLFPLAEAVVLWRGLRGRARTLLTALALVREHRELAFGEARAAGRIRRHDRLRALLEQHRAMLAPLFAASAAMAAMVLVGVGSVLVVRSRHVSLDGILPEAGAGPAVLGAFLAGLFDLLADWWDGLGPDGKALVVVGAVGVLSLFGMGVFPATMWALSATAVPETGHGIATFLRHPGRAVADFVSSRTPGDAVVVLAGSLFFRGKLPPGVRRAGSGWIDERLSTFNDLERRTARDLGREGHTVQKLPESRQTGKRTPDAVVDGVRTEFKTLETMKAREGIDGPVAATSNTVAKTLRSAAGQARNVIIDARGSGLTWDEAVRSLRRLEGVPERASRFDSVRIVGDGYELVWP